MQYSDDLLGQRQRRIDATQKLRELGIDPYPSKSQKDFPNEHIKTNYEEFEGKEVTLAGRLVSKRDHGKLIFGDILDQSGKIQLGIRKDQFEGDLEKSFLSWEQLNLLDIGDIIQVTGVVGKTQQGHVTIFAKHLKMLTKSIRPLPNTIEDKETIFRKRYLDLILHPENRWRFEKMAQITFAIREFLTSKGYLEIKTPIIQPVYGGTLAKPFKTHVNALNVDYYMAISHELYLKRLIAAGFENVFNLVGYFRNEGIDRSHNPEFTMIETMSAYHNYEYNMNLIEEMYKYIATKVFNKTTFKVSGQEVDFGKPWERISMLDAVKKYADIDFNEIKTVEEAHKVLEKIGADERPTSIGESMKVVFEEKVEKQLIQPTFLTGHPVEISPLAKAMDSDPRFVERFEIFIGGIEGGDNWTELNDPVELFNRFKAQYERKKHGDDESHPMDIEFVEMMEYGIPPTTGLGPGIERLAMMLTETDYIDDVIFFPMMKPPAITKQQIEIYGKENLIPSEKSELVSKEQDFSKKMVVVVRNDIEPWQVTNSVGHVSAYLGNQLQDSFGTGKYFTTKDGKHHPRNSQYPIVILSATEKELKSFMEKVRESELVYHGFFREMIETTNDAQIVETYKHKDDQEVEYLAIGVFGENEKVDDLTKRFGLFKGTKETTSSQQSAQLSVSSTPTANIDYKALHPKAVELVKQSIQNENLQRHCFDVEKCMRFYAKKLGQDEDKWGITGMLHDVDWEMYPDTHPNTAVPMLKELGVGQDVIDAILGHAYPSRTDTPRTTDMDHYLFACDELAGFIIAYSRMKPLDQIDPNGVMKKMKDKAFARAVSREDMVLGAEEIGIPLEEHIQNVIDALK